MYKVNVLAGGEHITESPFVLMVDPEKPGFHPSAAQLTGLEPDMDYAPDEPVSFRIDTRNTGGKSLLVVGNVHCGSMLPFPAMDEVPLVEVLDSGLCLEPVRSSQINPGIYGYSFVPKSSGKHHICASLAGVAVPGSPFMVRLSAVEVEGVQPSLMPFTSCGALQWGYQY